MKLFERKQKDDREGIKVPSEVHLRQDTNTTAETIIETIYPGLSSVQRDFYKEQRELIDSEYEAGAIWDGIFSKILYVLLGLFVITMLLVMSVEIFEVMIQNSAISGINVTALDWLVG